MFFMVVLPTILTQGKGINLNHGSSINFREYASIHRVKSWIIISSINFSDAVSILMGFMSSLIIFGGHTFIDMDNSEFSSPVNLHEHAST